MLPLKNCFSVDLVLNIGRPKPRIPSLWKTRNQLIKITPMTILSNYSILTCFLVILWVDLQKQKKDMNFRNRANFRFQILVFYYHDSNRDGNIFLRFIKVNIQVKKITIRYTLKKPCIWQWSFIFRLKQNNLHIFYLLLFNILMNCACLCVHS